MNHLPVYLDGFRWSIIFNAKINTVDLNTAPDAYGAYPNIKVIAKKTHVFDVNLQKKSLSQYNLNSKIKSQE